MWGTCKMQCNHRPHAAASHPACCLLPPRPPIYPQAGSSSEASPRPALRRDALGGDLMCSLMAALNFPLPSDAMRAVSACKEGLARAVVGTRSCSCSASAPAPLLHYAPSHGGQSIARHCPKVLCVHAVAHGPLPLVLVAPTQAGIHGHVFINGGNLVGLSGGGRSGLRSAWRDFSTSFRWSIVSVGLNRFAPDEGAAVLSSEFIQDASCRKS